LEAKLNNFIILKKQIEDDKSNSLTSYGIGYFNGANFIEINDITCDENLINMISEVFNTEQPDPIHIMDILENFLIDFTGF
jgi:hypothetical protein